MVPVYIYNEISNDLLVDYYILCDPKVLINTELLVELLEQEFSLSITASEFLYAIFWNSSYECIGILMVAKGTDNASHFKYSNVLRAGILINAKHFSLVHNHPGRTLVFSQDDVQSTKQFYILGKILKLFLHEHVLIAGDDFITLEGGDLNAEDAG